MANPIKNIFRKKSLDKLSSPERLDQLMLVIGPKGWWWLYTITLMISGIAIWAIFGKIPVEVTGKGVIVAPRKVSDLQALGTGRLLEIKIKNREQIKKGQIIGIIDQPALKLQIEQKTNLLALLKSQFLDNNLLKNKKNNLDLGTYEGQKKDYQKQIADAIKYRDSLKNNNLRLLQEQRRNYSEQIEELKTVNAKIVETGETALKSQRQSIENQLASYQPLYDNLNKMLIQQNELRAKELISVTIVLQTQQQIAQLISTLNNLQAQLKQIDVQEQQYQQQKFDNFNQIAELNNKLKELDIQQIQIQQDFDKTEDQIRELNLKLKSLESNKTEIKLTSQQDKNQQQQQITELEQSIQDLEQDLKQKSQIVSPFDGIVLEVSGLTGTIVSENQSIGKVLENLNDNELIVIAYFSIGDAKKITPGMRMEVTPSSVKRTDYGGIIGKVRHTSVFPVSTAGAAAVIGDVTLAEALTNQGTNIQVSADLELDLTTVSGYKWSSGAGPNFKISVGTTVLSLVTVEQRAPITFVIPLLKSITGLE